MNSALTRCASGARSDTSAILFSTGNDSPVNAASSTSRLCDSTTRQSAGTMSPARSSTMSPTTIWSTGTETSRPSRRTSACTCTRASSCSPARPAERSCQKPSPPLAAMITKMIAPSAKSPNVIDNTVASIRMRTIGLANWATNRRRPRWRRVTSIRFGPSRASRRAASSPDNPSTPADNRARTSDTGPAQKPEPDESAAPARVITSPRSQPGRYNATKASGQRPFRHL